MTDNPFRRQPQKVTVRLDGEPQDIDYWAKHLAKAV